ncbi:MAG: metal ABC transporter ATP-binding protein [Bacteroidales bacterium]|jgi:manganese/zinc/iron transport system ATP- binding protein|nr:metal ABC transporter ATP-binding protein [Bacteroidales bacterium]MDI9592997.1 metal ABC transporter ATP-binding protein [Bacteroidota bacterium]OQC36649.1 MAG: High-affinity zinc uptake system ATP-binding protein ZnuC [Bacteroidetes bacterium ADurb.Bin041]HNV50627.1 metal ABC transporter ATP-binding protein [Bacteroidales bacterium]HOF81446.1 metal ABC transporter ATP-binding protein [Bacteroidales bacterium]
MKKTLALQIHDLTVAYKFKPVLWDIDLSVPTGVMMAIVGPNGAGKSTLIKSVLNIVKPVAGTVTFFGKPYRSIRSKITYVPQKSSVDWDFPTTVLDLVMMGTYGKLGWIKRPGKKERKLALQAIEKVGLTGFERQQISQLSGGQQQRVFLARALVQQADLYFMDEPFQGIDATTEKAIIKILKELIEDNKTVIAVHHDLQTIVEYFDYIAFLNVRKIAEGKVEDVFTNENLEKTYGASFNFARHGQNIMQSPV